MSQPSNPRLLILAGGTGGHIFPGLAIAKEMQRRQWRVSWLGSAGGMEEGLLAQTNIELFLISVKGLRGKGILGWLTAPFKLLKSLSQARKVMRQCQPDLVLGFGGFASGPGGIAARIAGKKLVIHEQNAVAGLTNRVLSRLANLVIEAFPNSFIGHTIAADKSLKIRLLSKYKTLGNPLRQEIQELSGLALRKVQTPINILVLGGSRGAQSLNNMVPKIVHKFIAQGRVRVKHQCGKNKDVETHDNYALLQASTEWVEIVEFIQDMKLAYQWADLVICRSGALTVAEIAAVGIAAVFIPYPYAVDDHQTQNALWLANAGAALLIPETELESAKAIQKIEQLIEDPDTLEKMATTGRSLAYQNATQSIADACERLMSEVT